MSDPVPTRPICRQCTAVLDADDNYCRRCGAATPFGVASGVSPREKRPAVWESPWVVLPLLFFVLGPLALPLLWRSRQFTLFWKVVLTAFVTVLTALLMGMTLICTQQALSPLLKALEMNGP